MTLDEQLRAFHRIVVGVTAPSDGEALVRAEGLEGVAPATRLRVYANAYRSRLGGALDKDYPKLRALLGGEAFVAMGRAYLAAHPPSDFSLREAGAKLPRFLFELPDRNFAHVDLARLERARVEAFDGKDALVLTREAVAALPPEEFPGLRLRLVPTASFVLMTTNADDVWDAIESRAPIPARADTPRTVLVWRRDITVVHRTLEQDEVSLLHRVEGGGTFAQMCELLAGRADATERAIALLLRWLDAEILRA